MIQDRVDLVVLDMAGTTIAATDAVPAALEVAFAERGIELPASAIASVRGRSKRAAIRVLLDRLAADRPELDTLSDGIFASFRATLVRMYSDGVAPIAGAEETLRFLRDNGVRTVLTTGFDRSLAEQLLRQVGWSARLVNAVVTADDVVRGRPDPELIHRAMAMVGVHRADRVVVVGDTQADLQAARAAAVGWGIGVLSGAHTMEQLSAMPHTAILDSIADLPSWLMTHCGQQ